MKLAELIPVDIWVAEDEDKIFRHSKNIITTDDSRVCEFVMHHKRAYNSDKMREHITHYLNYFEKFYDTEHELLFMYRKIRYMIDRAKSEYTKSALMNDVRYILYGGIFDNIRRMNLANYKRGTAHSDAEYHYGLCLMEISLFTKILVPVLSHFMFANNIEERNAFVLEIFNIIISRYESVGINIRVLTVAEFTKHYTNCEAPDNINSLIKRSIDALIVNIIPKYEFNVDIIKLNYVAIKTDIKYKNMNFPDAVSNNTPIPEVETVSQCNVVCKACKTNNLDTIKNIVENNNGFYDYVDLFLSAIGYGANEEIVDYLIDALGVDFTKDSIGHKALVITVQTNYFSMFNHLRNKGAKSECELEKLSGKSVL